MRLALLSCLLLGACAVPDVAVVPACPVAGPSPGGGPLARAIADEAIKAWQDWGAVTRDVVPGDFSRSEGGARMFFGRHDLHVSDGLPWLRDGEPGAFARLADYGCAVPDGPHYWQVAVDLAPGEAVADEAGNLRPEVWRRIPMGRWPAASPWSGSFVSWVMRAAGVAPGDFGYGADPRAFVARASNPGGVFMPADAFAVAARPGDLLCAEMADGTHALHCEVVIGTTGCAFSPAGRCLEAIGGDVADSVVRSRYVIDAAGRLPPRHAITDRRWAAILRLAP